MDSEVVVHYKQVSSRRGSGKEGSRDFLWEPIGRKRAGKFVIDDGVTPMSHSYRWDSPASGNYLPLSHSASWGLGLTLIAGQPLGVCGLSTGSFEVMISRSLSGDDGKGLGEGLGKGRRASAVLGVIIGEEGEAGNRGLVEARSIASANFRKAPVIVGSATTKSHAPVGAEKFSPPPGGGLPLSQRGSVLGVAGETSHPVNPSNWPLEIVSFQSWSPSELSFISSSSSDKRNVSTESSKFSLRPPRQPPPSSEYPPDVVVSRDIDALVGYQDSALYVRVRNVDISSGSSSSSSYSSSSYSNGVGGGGGESAAAAGKKGAKVSAEWILSPIRACAIERTMLDFSPVQQTTTTTTTQKGSGTEDVYVMPGEIVALKVIFDC